MDRVTLAFHHETRRQNWDELLLGNSRTGAVTTAYSETSKTWLDASDPLVMDPVRTAFWLHDGSLFTWISDKDGWRHIYVVSREGRRETLVTRFDGDATRLTASDR